MKINVREFLDASFNHGDYIEIVNNKESKTPGLVYKTLWKGKYETIDNHIDFKIRELEVVKWGIYNNGITLYVNYDE